MAESKSQTTTKSRRWCITYHIKEGDNREELEWGDIFEDKDNKIKYFVGQIEETRAGGKHWQMYVEFTDNCTMGQVKTRLTDDKKSDMHLEKARGTAQQASDYCEKEESKAENNRPFKYGRMGQQGQRTDLESVTTSILAGKRMAEIALQDPTTYVKYHKGLHAFKSITSNNKARSHINIFYWAAATGVGKTQLAKKVASIIGEQECYWYNSGQGKWFDGYDDHKVVIMDEYVFDDKKELGIKLGPILTYLDTAPVQVQIKGGTSKLIATDFFIFSNASIEQQYLGEPQRPALMRRIRDYGVDLSNEINRKVLILNCEEGTGKGFEYIYDKDGYAYQEQEVRNKLGMCKYYEEQEVIVIDDQEEKIDLPELRFEPWVPYVPQNEEEQEDQEDMAERVKMNTFVMDLFKGGKSGDEEE